MDMRKIQVDEEIFQFLQEHAKPFVDSPNDVLRRLLLKRDPESQSGNRAADSGQPRHRSSAVAKSGHAAVSMDYVRTFLHSNFPSEAFRRVGSYQFMFESDNRLIYFQNFNKDSNRWWYRIAERPWRLLQDRADKAWVCFTNPAVGEAFLIPVSDIVARVREAGWDRSYLEVNIDYERARWTELEWSISKYLRK